jgi:uncharacterized protein (TIGR02594 family)
MSDLVWMIEAKRWLGVHERRDHGKLFPAVRRWLREKYDPRETPWCGAFMGIVFKSALPNEPIPDAPWGARNWLKFGRPCPLQTGAVAVFWRGKRQGWSGHVGFIDAIDHKNRRVRVLGGNQSDAVTLSWLSIDRLLGTRWPTTVPAGSGKVHTASSSGAAVSTNEE